MKFIHRDNYKSYIICLVAFILSAIAFPHLPEQIAIHFDAQGVPDSYGSPLTIFLLPSIMLFVNVLAEITKHTDPRKNNYSYFSKHYYLIHLVLNIFLLLVQLYIISFSLQLIIFTLTNIIVIAMGVLFIIIGNMLPKVKQNFFMGIKTPWTLADEYVWYATHRFSGKLWFALGLIMCACGFFPNNALVPVILISAIAAAVVPMIYSYIIYKKGHRNE